jgi:hypothetical protein
MVNVSSRLSMSIHVYNYLQIEFKGEAPINNKAYVLTFIISVMIHMSSFL